MAWGTCSLLGKQEASEDSSGMNELSNPSIRPSEQEAVMGPGQEDLLYHLEASQAAPLTSPSWLSHL